MALFKPFRGNSTGLDTVPKTDGHAYFCTDDGTFWIDYTDPVDNQVKRKFVNEAITRALQAEVAKKYDISPYIDFVGSVPCTVKNKDTGMEETDVAVMAADNEKETIIFRDKNGRAEIEAPEKEKEIANKQYVDEVSKGFLHRVSANLYFTNDRLDDYRGTQYTVVVQFHFYSSRSEVIATLEEFLEEMHKVNAIYSLYALMDGNLSTPILNAHLATASNELWFFGYVIDQGVMRMISGAPIFTGVTGFEPKRI